MTQQMLFDQTPPRQKKRVNVPRTSAEVYFSIDAHSRRRIVASWLKDYVLHCDHEPTSAELADYANGSLGNMSIDMHLLYVRRGLSDALALGLVEHAGQRKCQVSGRACVTWKVRTR